MAIIFVAPGENDLKPTDHVDHASERKAQHGSHAAESSAGSSFLTVLDPRALRTGSRADFVYQSVRNAIWDGHFARGERIREEDIAKSLGVSRTPVREALQRLQQRGLLVTSPGRGLAVAQMSVKQVFDLYAMREILEGSAAGFAARHATEAEVQILYSLQKQLSVEGHDALALVTLNRRFHQHIYEAAHNEYLLDTLEVLNDSMALLHNLTSRMPTRREQSDSEHLKIVQAIEKRDAEGAERASRNHIQQAQKSRLEYFAAEDTRV